MIEKVQELSQPREKLNNITEAFSAMKAEVVDFHQGKVELEAMDDQLPLLIYCVSQVSMPRLKSELAFLEDYLKFSGGGQMN